MRTLSSALNTAYGYPVQRPAWFVEVSFAAGTEYYSSFATVAWNSHIWTAQDVDVSSLRVGPMSISGDIVFGNADDYFGTRALGSWFQNRRVRVWGCDGSMAALADTDPFLLCDGVGAGCNVAEDYVRVAVRDFIEYAVGPRQTVSPTFGFYTYLPAGKTIRINNVDYRIEG